MAIDFKKLKKEFQEGKKKRGNVIHAVILGPRGSGKSTTGAGTWGKDTRVLHLVYSREAHGADSASSITESSDYTAIVIEELGTRSDEPKVLYDRTVKLLAQPDIADNFDVVVLDGMSVLDFVIQNHPDVQKANGYEKPSTVATLYEPVVKALVSLRDAGVHTVVTCSTERRESNGVAVSVPAVRGRVGIDALIGSMSEILCLERVEVDVPNQEKQVTAIVFDFEVNVEKTGTKISKEKVFSTHNPRVTGKRTEDMPRFMKASMQKLLEFKTK